MLEIINIFKVEMLHIFVEDILTHHLYFFTRETASRIRENCPNSVPLSVCHLHRAIQHTYINTTKTLKHMVARMVPGVRRIPSTKYELVCTLLYHYMNHGEGQHELDSENPVLTRLYMDYLTRGHIGNMSAEDNMAQLRFEISPIVIRELESVRVNHVRRLARRYDLSRNEEKLEFVYNGMRDIRNYSNRSAYRPGGFPRMSVFGNVLYTDIITHFPLFRNAIQQRIDDIEQREADERAAVIVAMAEVNRRGAETPQRAQQPQPQPQGWVQVPQNRIRQLDLPRYQRPNPVKYGVDLCFTSTEECPICYEKTCDAYVDCKHAFCLGCIKQHVDTSNARRSLPICPMCRVDVKQVNSNEDRGQPEMDVVDLTV
jgi:hypothetical protein